MALVGTTVDSLCLSPMRGFLRTFCVNADDFGDREYIATPALCTVLSYKVFWPLKYRATCDTGLGRMEINKYI